MKDENKTREQLMTELVEMRHRVVELEASKAERKRVEGALQRSEEKFRIIFESIADAVAVTDLELKLTDINRAGVQMLGYSHKEELLGKSGFEIVSDKDRAKAIQDMSVTLASGRSGTLDYNFLSKDGAEIPSEYSVAVMRDSSGAPTGFVAVVKDITERKRVEEKLRESEERYRNLIENALDIIYTVSLDGVFTSLNPAFETITGWSCSESIGKQFVSFLHPDDLPRAMELFQDAVQAGRAGTLEARVLARSGEYLQAEVRSAPLTKNEKMVGFWGIARDITERKRAEEALRVSEEKYRTILQNIEEGYYEVDIAGNSTVFNNSMRRILGYPEGELMGMNYRQYMDDENAKKAYQTFNRVYRTGKPAEAFGREVITREGTRKFVEASVSLTRDSQGEPAGFRGIVRDITERKRVEEELIRVSNAVKMSTDSIVMSDLDANIIDVNEATLEMFGTDDKRDLIGKNSFDLIAPEEREKALTGTKEVLEKGYLKGREYYIMTKDGARIPVEMSVAIMKGADGKPTGFVAVSRDISERKRAEERLQESEGTMRALLNAPTDSAMLIDIEGIIFVTNEVGAKRFGKSVDELLGECVYDLLPPGVTESRRAWDDEVVRSGKPVRFEDEHGGRIFDTLVYPVLDARGEVKRLAIFTSDITRRKQVEQELWESQEFSSSLLSNTPTPIVVVNPDTSLRYLNSALEKLTGFSSAELVGKKAPYPWWTEETLPKTHRDLEEAMRKGARRLEELFQKKDGERFWVEITSVPVITDGQLKYYLANWVDITERKRAEESLKESEGRYRMLFENSIEGVFTVHLDGNFTSYNNAGAELYGYNREELIGTSYKNLVAPENAEFVFEEYNKLFRTGEPIRNLAYEVITKSGERRLAEGYVNVIREGDRIVGFQGTLRDITERRRAEERLRKADEDWCSSFNSLEDVMLIIDKDYNIENINDNGLALIGQSREEVIGRKCYQIIADVDSPVEDCPCKRTLETKRVESVDQYEERFGRYFSIKSSPIFDENGEIVRLVDLRRDITERKQAEDALRESEERWRSLVENAPNLIIIVDPDGTMQFINYTVSGFTKEEVIGRSIYEYIQPEYHDVVRGTIERVFETGESGSLEIRGTGPDGRVSWYVVRVGSMKCDGRVVAVTLITTDITEQKRAEAERRELEQRAHLASRLSTVGEMASGIAHEINNPLTAVIGFAQLLMRKDIPEDIKEEVKIINDSAQRVAGIVKRLLAFARQQKPEQVYADINDIVESTLGMRAYAMETSNIKVVTQLDPELPRTMADAAQLQQVFLNIILNAETEMKLAHGSGKLLVKTVAADNTIRISFKDDGPGIAKEDLGRVFDPFFTTREVGEGTGLGLSICHAIVAEHNGQLHVKSKLGKGATFIVELPVIAEEKQLGLPEPAPDDSTKIGRAKILVVDDEPATLELLSQILTAEGHEVQTADNATDALERIKSERYSLILLDIKLPGVSGIELYSSIQKMAESLARRVLFITGDVRGVDTKDFLSKTKAPHVAKPFDIEQLKQAVDRMLAGSA